MKEEEDQSVNFINMYTFFGGYNSSSVRTHTFVIRRQNVKGNSTKSNKIENEQKTKKKKLKVAKHVLCVIHTRERA